MLVPLGGKLRGIISPVCIGFILLLSGCVTPPQQTVQMNYTAVEFDAYKGTGDATVYGQAFLRQRGGGVVVCAGERVVLFPHTPSFEKVMAVARQHVQPVLGDSADPRFKTVARVATCDAQGNFKFTDLPRAPWYIYSRVSWSVGDYGQQGGDLVGEVDTTGGGEHQVFLTDSNLM